jgi:hypothetical protein
MGSIALQLALIISTMTKPKIVRSIWPTAYGKP